MISKKGTMTQLKIAKLNKVSAEMRYISKKENIPLEVLKGRIKGGSVVILKNIKRDVLPCAVGKGLTTKVNANLGTSRDRINLKLELRKLRSAIENGADTVMDLSTGGDIRKIRKAILENSTVPVGTVPIYQAVIKACSGKGRISCMTKDDILEAFEEQARDGVDFFTVHCGVTQDTLTRLKRKKRLIEVVSRGGAFLSEWMILNKKENPLYEYFDDILEIARKYDVTLSLGDGMRPGSIIDATDRPQIQELIILGELAEKARNNNIQVMIEGPGHMPMDQIESNVIIEKKLCNDAPFYVLGPLVTDIAPGYDHIVGAIGGAMAGFYGADFLCYVTPSEHLSIPDVDDVKNGVIASRIAAHAADIAKAVPGVMDWDKKMSEFRAQRNWKSQIKKSIDPVKATAYRKSAMPKKSDVCTMCSDFCSMKIIKRYFK